MSPERNTPTSENNNEKPYLTKAQEVIAEAAANAPETNARFEVVDSYIADVLAAAAAGEISGSHGAYTEEDIVSQLLSFKEHAYAKGGSASDADKEVIDPFMLIPRASGLRDAFRSMWANDATHRDLEQAIQLRDPETQAELRSELLSTEKLHEIGEVGLSAAEVEQPSAEAPKMTRGEYLRTLTEGFSEDDIQALDAYAVTKSAQNRAAANGEYDNVAHWKREAFNDYKRLSKAAQKIAEQYAHAANYYE